MEQVYSTNSLYMHESLTIIRNSFRCPSPLQPYPLAVTLYIE